MSEMLQTIYAESTMSKSNVLKWNRCFKGGREDANNDEKQGHPVTKQTDENVTKIRELAQSDCQLTCRMIADDFGMSKETVKKILVQDLGMRDKT